MRILHLLAVLFFCCACQLAILGASDEIHFLTGNIVKGQFVEGDKTSIVFRVNDALQIFQKADIAAIYFNKTEIAAPGNFPPGFSAAAPYKLAHVIVMRRVTTNRVLEDGKYEPEIATISGDGSTVACFAPKSGLYLMNADGSNRRLLIATDGTPRTQFDGTRFALSYDGKIFYWQGGAPIYRINTDGTGEKLLVRNGAEYEAFRLREKCKKIFFSQRGGIFSIDTEGRGDYKEIITPKILSRQWEVPEEHCLLGRFDVSADGTRIAFVVGGFPKAPCAQLMAINGDGTGLRRIIATDFDPWALTMTPDGSKIIGWHYGIKAVLFNWDGSGMKDLPLPVWDGNGSGFQHLNRFSDDSQFFSYNGNESGGFGQICRQDGSERYEPQNIGNWDYHDNGLFHGLYSPSYSNDLRRFVSISQYWRHFKPRQIVVGDINPPQAPGVPVISDINFSPLISMNPQLPAHRGVLTVRIRKANSDIEKVQYSLLPMCMKFAKDPNRWIANAGWGALQGDHQLRDDGKNGDEKAGDGIYSTNNLAPDAGDNKVIPGRYLLRIVAHDDQSAVIVDVDGIEISNTNEIATLPTTVIPNVPDPLKPPVNENNITVAPVTTDSQEVVDAGISKIEAAFRARDLAAILSHVAPARQEKYRAIFTAHQAELTKLADLLATRTPLLITGSYAEYQLGNAGATCLAVFERYGTVWCLRDI